MKQNLDDPLGFMLAGNAIFTVRNCDSGNRYTYKMVKTKKGDVPAYFVSVLCGSDNSADYKYIGTAFKNDTGVVFRVTAKSCFSKDAPAVRGIDWILRHLQAGTLPECFKIYHEGRCGRCGRRLTVPESIITGFGPECVTRL